MNVRVQKLIFLGVGFFALSGCTSLKATNFDFIKFPEFKEEAENIGDYLSMSDVPPVPKITKNDKQWDQAAMSVQNKADELNVPDANQPNMTDAEIERKMKEYRETVEAYKLDDPQ
jgi:hypothetical protein